MTHISDWVITGKAEKQLAKLSKQTQADIVGKLDFYVASGHALSFAKRLTDYELGSYRFRIDKDWRVVFDLEEDKIVVTEIGHRSQMYK